MTKQCESAMCPCGSTRPYDSCCAPYVRGERNAPTAEALMRSRYAAYVRGETQYLHDTWHPATRPALSMLAADEGLVKWLGLKIVDVLDGKQDDDNGEVEFVARYKIGGKAGRLHERSRFVKHQGRWLYLEGEQR